MTIERKLLGTTPVSSGIEPEAVSFDGTNDYLKRTSDMTGNADGKTWTFSAWVYNTGVSQNIYSTYQSRFQVICQGNYFTISAKSTTEDAMFASYPNAPLNTWNHILISCNQASTSQRHIYINGVAHTTFNTYVNGNIDFTETQHYIGAANSNHINKLKGRLAHVYLDKTYRDLSVTSNRRLFITADGKPADSDTLSALNPIMYMPLIDAATAGSNSGTGGDFTAVGTLATAERGPNQDNCSASTFDGSADYLSRSSITGLSNGKLFTFSVNASQTTSNGQIFTASNGKVSIKIESNRVTTRLKGSVGVALYFDSPYPANKLSYGQHNSISFSCDLSDTSKRHMFINGVDVTSGITFTNYSNETALLVQTPYAIGSAQNGSGDFFNGSVGEFYLDTTYIDLATDNPFWDSTANRPNSVRKVIADTGVTPLIAMPLMGNDAGNNLGSGGDFTVNSGPYVGARGGSEYWARSAKMPTSAYLNRSLTATTRQFSVALAYKTPNINTTARLQFGADTIFLDIQNNMEIRVQAGGSTIANINCSTSNISNDTWYTLLICYDSDNSSKNKVYVNGVSSISSQTNISAGDVVLNGTAYFPQQAAANAEMSGLYFTTDYIDFNQEVNRNKFIDQLGYLIDLTPAIEAGDISNPLIYTKFEDTAALGTNSGTAGNLGVSGTVTAGSDFSI